MKYRVHHETIYDYSEPVSICHSTAHVSPRQIASRQSCGPCRIEIDPVPDSLSARVDCFGNQVVYFSVQRPHQRLTVTAESEVEIISESRPEPGALPRAGCPWGETRDRVREMREERFIDPVQFVFDSPLVRTGRELGEYAGQSFTPGRPIVEATADLTARIHRDFKYDATATNVGTPLEEVWTNRRGVCQDFAHIQIACLRSLGLPARYVSGYLLTRPPPGRPRLVGADASHAWIAVFCPETGWVDFDPTNNVLPREQHIAVAWGRDFSEVSPIRGVILGGGQHSVSVSVDMEGIGV